MERTSRSRWLWIAVGFALGFVWIPAHAKGTDKYSKLETRLSRVPRYPFRDRRMKKVFRKMARQYKLIYGHASADGYVLPNELRDLKFQRQFMLRLYLIDKRRHELRRDLRAFRRKCRRKYRRARRRARRRGKSFRMSVSDERKMTLLKKESARYEAMIRRFACRYLPRYKKRYRTSHCRKKKVKLEDE